MNLIDHFKAFLHKHSLQGKKVLLMISGGVDSMVLFNICSQVLKPEQIAVFHLNHKTRPTSGEDALFVQNNCLKLGVPCFIEALNPSSEKNKEALWRKERQDRSQAVQENINADTILTAHHATDLIETMIHRLTKGCGIDGLSPFDITTKPFWNVPKHVLVEYAKTHDIPWREDVSNEDTQHERNLIRKEILPHLRTITPNLEQVFVKESALFAETADYIDIQTHTFLTGKTNILLSELLDQHIFLQKNILRHLAESPISGDEVRDCLKWLHNNPQGGSKKTLGGKKLWIKKHCLCW